MATLAGLLAAAGFGGFLIGILGALLRWPLWLIFVIGSAWGFLVSRMFL